MEVPSGAGLLRHGTISFSQVPSWPLQLREGGAGVWPQPVRGACEAVQSAAPAGTMAMLCVCWAEFGQLLGLSPEGQVDTTTVKGFCSLPKKMVRLELCIFSTFLILLHSPCAVLVVVRSDRPRVEVPENGDAVLSCLFNTERESNPRIEWKKKGKDVSFVYFDGQFRGDFTNRATIDGATVTLHKVTQKDTGVYRCEVSAPLDKVNLGETNVTLKVLVPPHTPWCEIPSSALTGSMVELHCRDEQSVPPATYKWYKDNKLLSIPRQAPSNITYSVDAKTGTLSFSTVSRADTGQYRCEASNGVGLPKSCEGKHMKIDDVNWPVIIAVVVVIIIITICGLGVGYAYRQGYFRRGHSGRSFWIPQCHGNAHISSQNLHRADDINNTSYSPPQDSQDFKHTKSFML
ncbi:hypothetical protein AGOR_G00064550 [Albula goreensis]|uniref:Ig-like domain-containing protein n=1 Tax=Albula goreensis TaxID=1534307 RepID=A0A8T3DYG2_9TELE|nr:hypothetical protein AGOR_G00064550 [Albula goreensis]